MRTTGGTCIHCGQYVERGEDLFLVTASGDRSCGGSKEPHQVDEEEGVTV